MKDSNIVAAYKSLEYAMQEVNGAMAAMNLPTPSALYIARESAELAVKLLFTALDEMKTLDGGEEKKPDYTKTVNWENVPTGTDIVKVEGMVDTHDGFKAVWFNIFKRPT